MTQRTNHTGRKKGANGPPIKPAHPLKREIRGLLVLLLAILLTGSLLSYDPADRLLWSVTGPVGKAHNLFGTVGSHIAGALFAVLGFSSFWLPLTLLAMALMSFRGRTASFPMLTFISVLALLASSSTILDLLFPARILFRGESMAAGGLTGLHMAAWVKGVLNDFGAYVFLAALWIVSFMLVTDLSLGRILSRVGLWIIGLMKGIGEVATKIRERKKRTRKTRVAHNQMAARPKVTIVDTGPTEPAPPRQEAFPFMHVAGEFKLPPLDLLKDPPEQTNVQIQRETLEMNARRLERKLADFGVEGEVMEILPGPVITMYEYKPAPGIKISKVANLSDDLALTLRAQSIRIVAPIPGKAAIGIEIPNNQREVVYLKEILSSPTYQNSKHRLAIALGKDITGAAVVADLTKMPHLLVAGATGTGKSVSINTMIMSLLFKVPPDMVRFLMIDPKRIELSTYQDIPHLLHPVVTQPKDATKALQWAVEEMERRYMLLSDRGVRNIETYNRKIVGESKGPLQDASRGVDRTIPYIVIIIDELADLMMVSSKEVEEAITRLAQMARAAGIHLIIATQRPSVNVLTGIIKANFPTRLSFQVSSKVDSRTILDANGAEHLLGDGDMLFMPPGVGRLMRIHGAYVSEEEVKAVADFLKKEKVPDYDTTILSHMAGEEEGEKDDVELDEKYEEAVDLVSRTGQASISMLQRKLRVGYNRAARMIEVMEARGIVGPSDGVRPRDVYGRKAE